MQAKYISELQVYYRSVHKVAELCQPINTDIPLTPQQPDQDASWSGDYVSLQQWMLDLVGGNHLYIVSAQTAPCSITRALYILLIYGEALFLKFMPDLLKYWQDLVSSPRGDIPWDFAVLAGLVHCHACLLRELHDLSVAELYILFCAKQGFFKALSTMSIPRLIEDYSREPFVTRNLMLDMMLAASQGRGNDVAYFSRRGEFISMAIRISPIRKIPREQYPELEQLLNQDEIRSMYLSICTTRTNRLNISKYSAAVSDFLDNLYSTNLHYAFDRVYGVTLSGRQAIIDDTLPIRGEHFEALRRGYRAVIIIHELAHFLVRAHTNTVKDFLKNATPTKEATLDSEPQHQDCEVIEHRTQVREVIDANFPLDEHGEAGYMLEEVLFGGELTHINAAASMQLLELAQQPRSLAAFKHDFEIANKLPMERSPRMPLHREGSAGKGIMFFGRCGMPQPYSHY